MFHFMSIVVEGVHSRAWSEAAATTEITLARSIPVPVFIFAKRENQIMNGSTSVEIPSQ